MTTAISLSAAIGLCLDEQQAIAKPCNKSDSASSLYGKLDSSQDLGCGKGGGGGPGGGPGSTPKRSTYCDEVNQTPSKSDTSIPKLVFAPTSEPAGLYRYADGRQDEQYDLVDYEMRTQSKRGGSWNLSSTESILVTNGGPATHEKFRISCQATGPAGLVVEKEQEVWVPVMTADAVAAGVDLFADVEGQLVTPEIRFVDADIESEWLWVNVDHRISIPVPPTIFEEETRVDETEWANPDSVTAWVRAVPVALSVEVQEEGGERYLGSCDLATATDGTGCRVQFTHSSSIVADKKFHGVATLQWELSSNAGILDGLGPIYTNAEFSVEVAEAMAVSDTTQP